MTATTKSTPLMLPSAWGGLLLWVIQPAAGPLSTGVCQVCGAQREFKNYCAACESVCPVIAIFAEDATPPQFAPYIAVNYDYFKNTDPSTLKRK